MTRIGVKTRKLRNLYVLIVFAPGSRSRVIQRLQSRRPWTAIEPGATLRIGRARLRVTAVERVVERVAGDVEHRLLVDTRFVRRKVRRRPPANVIRMPARDDSAIADFLRYYVLVHVWNGDPDAWLAHLASRRDVDGDVRFARWVRTRLRKDPMLMVSIRRMVDAVPLVMGAG